MTASTPQSRPFRPQRTPAASGDGKVFVTDVSKAVRIRTGETNNDAL